MPDSVAQGASAIEFPKRFAIAIFTVPTDICLRSVELLCKATAKPQPVLRHSQLQRIRGGLFSGTFGVHRCIVGDYLPVGPPRRVLLSEKIAFRLRSTLWKSYQANMFKEPFPFSKTLERTFLGSVLLHPCMRRAPQNKSERALELHE